jgi:hypothetical protein
MIGSSAQRGYRRSLSNCRRFDYLSWVTPMTTLGRIGKRIGDKLGELTAGKIAAALGIAAAAVWAWLWYHFDPNFSYKTQPAPQDLQFVSLSQILNQIEKDSHVDCGGDWGSRIAWIGLRKCYTFTFDPPPTYQMNICTHDQRTAEISTPDQLLAVRYFENRFTPLQCFKVAQRGDTNSYDIAPGKDTRFRKVQFSSDNPQDTAFCGCSDDEVREIARTIGATLP